jgi:Na+/alanine symporter
MSTNDQRSALTSSQRLIAVALAILVVLVVFLDTGSVTAVALIVGPIMGFLWWLDGRPGPPSQ